MDNIKKILFFTALGIFGIVGIGKGVSVFNSNQVGTNPVAGSVLQTDGSKSSWVPTSTLGISGSTINASDTQIVFMAASTPTGDNNLTWNSIGQQLYLNGSILFPNDFNVISTAGTPQFYRGDNVAFTLNLNTMTGNQILTVPDSSGLIALGSGTMGNCATWSTQSTLTDTGSPCGSGGSSSTNIFAGDYIGVTASGTNGYIISNTGVTSTGGNWAGTWQLRNPSDFLSSSTNIAPSTTIPTIYVSTFNGATGTAQYSVSCTSGCTAVTSTTSTALTVTASGGVATTSPFIDQNLAIASGTAIATVSTSTFIQNFAGSYIPFIPQILGTSTQTRYYFGGYSSGQAATNSTDASNTMYALPIFISQNSHITDIETDCEGTCVGTAHMGVYNDIGGMPGTLVLDPGTSTLAIGTIRKSNLNTQLYPGQYWLVVSYSVNASVKSHNTNGLVANGIGAGATINAATTNFGIITSTFTSTSTTVLPNAFPTSSLAFPTSPPFPLVGIHLNP